MKKPANIDEYIAAFPQNIQTLLQQLRTTITFAAPEADEVISYGMPAFKQNGILAYFAAHSHHIGFYPMASGVSNFTKKLSVYKGAKGSVQFPFTHPLPIKLITDIVQFRVEENLQKKKKK